MLIILLTISILLLFTISYGSTPTNEISQCKCVVFRIDDIQDYWLNSSQLAIMDLFISKNQSVSIGLILDDIGNDDQILYKIKEGLHKGIFELDIHGWHHVNYRNLTEEEQKKSLYIANEKIRTIFKIRSTTFIPPEGVFDNTTLNVMEELGIRILSSGWGMENYYEHNNIIFNANKIYENSSNGKPNQKIYHLPYTTSFTDYKHGKWIKNPIKNIIENVTNNINKFGYAVVVVHPQDFVKIENGEFVNEIVYDEIKDLSKLIDLFISKEISITTFSKIIGINPYI